MTASPILRLWRFTINQTATPQLREEFLHGLFILSFDRFGGDDDPLLPVEVPHLQAATPRTAEGRLRSPTGSTSEQWLHQW
jgi:hypothetical protein